MDEAKEKQIFNNEKAFIKRLAMRLLNWLAIRSSSGRGGCML